MQTDGSEPNKLLVVTADIPRPRVAAAETLGCWSETGKSPFLSKPSKTLFHPGEVGAWRQLVGGAVGRGGVCWVGRWWVVVLLPKVVEEECRGQEGMKRVSLPGHEEVVEEECRGQGGMRRW